MIPIGDNIPSHRQPIGNYLLLAINVALFLWELKLEVTGELSEKVNSWGVVPARISAVTADALVSGNPAAWIALLILSSTLLQGMFLHSSFGQILGNLLFLWVFGKSVENLLGHGRFVVFYLLCGVLTGMMQVLAEPTLTVPLIGANGAITGVLGAYMLSFPKARIDTIMPLLIVLIPIELPALFYLFWWFVQQVFYSVGNLNVAPAVNPPGIVYWTHPVSLVIGAVLVRLLNKETGDRR